MPEVSFSLQIASQVSPVHTTGKNAENLVINTKQQTFLSGFCGKNQSIGKICFIDVWPPEVETWMTEVENQMLAAIREAPHQRQNGDTISLYLVGDWRFYMILDVHELMVMTHMTDDVMYYYVPGTVPQEIINK